MVKEKNIVFVKSWLPILDSMDINNFVGLVKKDLGKGYLGSNSWEKIQYYNKYTIELIINNTRYVKHYYKAQNRDMDFYYVKRRFYTQDKQYNWVPKYKIPKEYESDKI